MNAIKWKGYVEGTPWNLLALVSGFGIVSSGIIATISFSYYARPLKPFLEKVLVFLVYAILLACGFGTPTVGLWLYLR
jgi:hypothetical protein